MINVRIFDSFLLLFLYEILRFHFVEVLEYPSYLFGINKETLKTKLTSRIIETRQEKIDSLFNVQKAEYTRDALAKALYSRLFDYLVDVSKVSKKFLFFF
jgi:myosin-1